MRTGADYRQSLRDGRKVWVMGEGLVDDVTTHPATRAMVDEYVAWYDRHADPAWQDTLLAPPTAVAAPGATCVPTSADDLVAHGPLLFGHDVPQRRQHHPHAGLRPSDRARHPGRGAGAQRLGQSRSPMPRPIATMIAAHRALPHLLRRRARPSAIACARIRPSAPRFSIVRETDAGVVISGKIGMHTSPAYAEDVYHRRAQTASRSARIAPPSSCRSTRRASP